MEDVGCERAAACRRSCQRNPENRKDDTCQELRTVKSCVQLPAISETGRENLSFCPTNPDEGATIIGKCCAELNANKCTAVFQAVISE